MDPRVRLAELATLRHPTAPVVSLYLATRWSDEHQRQRARVFVKQEVARARATAAPGLDGDLDWVEQQAAQYIEQAAAPEAHGVAVFACQALGLREVHPLGVPVADVFSVDDRPYVKPLADVLEACPDGLVVFVDAERARLIPLGPGGPQDEVTLAHDVPGHHRRGGWALLAQSRYQRHIQAVRDRHLAAVAEVIGALVGTGAARIVLAGESRMRAALRRHLPAGVDRRVTEIVGSHHEPAGTLAARAMAALAEAIRAATAAALDEVLVEAAKGGRAVAGLPATLEAVACGAVRRLFLDRGFTAAGSVCRHCGTMLAERPPGCPLCGRTLHRVELAEAMVEAVLEAGGAVDMVEQHRALAARGGVAARVRYTLPNGGRS